MSALLRVLGQLLVALVVLTVVLVGLQDVAPLVRVPSATSVLTLGAYAAVALLGFRHVHAKHERSPPRRLLPRRRVLPPAPIEDP